MQRASLGLLAAVAGFAALAGCGEKDEPETTGAVVPVETTTSTTATTTRSEDPLGLSAPIAVEAFLSSADAEAVCDELLTAAFLREGYGGRAGCVAARKPTSLAEPDSKLLVHPANGSETLVVAEPVGGLYDGEKLRFSVLQEGNAFLIDEIASNAPVGP